MNPNIEFYKCIADRRNHSKQSLQRVLNWMQTNSTLKQKTENYRHWLKTHPDATPKEKSDQKKNSFPCVQFGGTFTRTGQAEDIDQLSGLIVLDFDHLSNLETIREALKQDPYTYLLFVSPSNDGLKLVMKHDLKNPDNWKYLYYEIKKHYLTIVEADGSGKDISRQCFLPFVPDLYQNPNCQVWNYKGDILTDPTEYRKPVREVKQSELTEDNDIFKECYFLAHYLFKHKIDIADSYLDWMSYGFSIAELGEQGREIFHMMSSMNKNYDQDETDKEFDKYIERYNPDQSGINLFISGSKRAIAEYQIYKEYNYKAF